MRSCGVLQGERIPSLSSPKQRVLAHGGRSSTKEQWRSEENMSADRGFSDTSLRLSDSITHGTRAKIDLINRGLQAEDQVIDLSIGTLDLPADRRIDHGVCELIQTNAEIIHAFAPVKGFSFLRSSIAAKIKRMHGVEVDLESEVLVTPGGIKGASESAAAGSPGVPGAQPRDRTTDEQECPVCRAEHQYVGAHRGSQLRLPPPDRAPDPRPRSGMSRSAHKLGRIGT